MQYSENPKRIVLRFSINYELDEAIILEGFFALYNPETIDDYYAHLIAPDGSSSKMHIVLDLRCRTSPVVDIGTIDYEVYRVRKNDKLYVPPSSARTMVEHN